MTDHKHKSISDAEESRIQKTVASDPDAPKASDDQLAEAKPFAGAFPALADNMRRNVGAVSIRLDPDVVARFKATGPGWQSRMNDVLRREVPRGDL